MTRLLFLAVGFFALCHSQASSASLTPAQQKQARDLAQLIVDNRIYLSQSVMDGRVANIDNLTGVQRMAAMRRLVWSLLTITERDQAAQWAQALREEAERQGSTSYRQMADLYLDYINNMGEITPEVFERMSKLASSQAVRADVQVAMVADQILADLSALSGQPYRAVRIMTENISAAPGEFSELQFIHAEAYQVLVYLYVVSNQVDGALEAAQNAVRRSLELGYVIDGHAILHNIAFIARRKGNFDVAEDLFRAMVSLAETDNNSTVLFYANYGLSLARQEQGDYRGSLEAANEAFATGFTQDERFMALLNSFQSVNYARTGNIGRARTHLERARPYFEGQQDVSTTRWITYLKKTESILAEAEGNYAEALRLRDIYFEDYLAALKAEFGADMAQLTASMESDLERSIADREMLSARAALAAEQARNDRMLMGLVTVLALSAILAFLLQKKYAAQLKASQKNAERANAAKSEFLAHMSHELRTPLNAIIGFSELMRTGAFGKLNNPKYEDYAQAINSSGQHLLDIVNDILDLSRIEAGKTLLDEKEVAINVILDEARELLEPRLNEADLRLEVATDPQDSLIYIDQRLIKQSVLNLLSNSVKFTAKGGLIQMSAQRTENGDMQIWVRDNGIGMTKQEIDLAVEPFGQIQDVLSRNYEGTGLGLPLVKSLIELHEGELHIQSSPGVGTSVCLTLPRNRVIGQHRGQVVTLRPVAAT